MFIEQGFAALSPPVVAPGVYFAQLEKDLISPTVPMAIAYRSVSEDLNYNLSGPGIYEWHVQIDCHGYARADAVNLSRAVKSILDKGFRGTFPDVDSTRVAGIFRIGQVDGFSDANRSYVRSLEYVVQYYPPAVFV